MSKDPLAIRFLGKLRGMKFVPNYSISVDQLVKLGLMFSFLKSAQRTRQAGFRMKVSGRSVGLFICLLGLL